MQRSAIGILSIAAAVCVSCGRTGLDTAAMKPTDRSVPAYRAPGDWIAAEAIPFSPDSPESFNAAVAGLVEELDGRVELLGIGEPLHGGEGFLLLRNRLFQRLAEAHGFGAIAVESDFFRGRLVDEFVSGRGPASYEEVREEGFSHTFGRLDANRELVEWMRSRNADPSRPTRLRFYGFDGPMEMIGTPSPRRLVLFALDYLASADRPAAEARRARIEPLLGDDAAWEDPAASTDPSKAFGSSPAAAALRVETEELIADLRARRPALAADEGRDRYLEAVHHAEMARHLLNYHAALARRSEARIAEMLGIRDLMMADTLAYIATLECGRGKVLVFAHNSHLKRGKAEWQLGPHALAWWPAGAHLDSMLGARYAVVGAGLGVSEDNGIGVPEPGTLEALLTAAPGPARFIPTHRGTQFPPGTLPAIRARSGSARNPGYFPLDARSFTDYDWLAVLDSTSYSRGAPPLP